ncbi:hypothetical protein B0J13DRAFT_533409 [Dactylonectria estremocensis]|uniref:Uncharacterized protein n=1 Tax=Dactylonectria estremocensis TaxID=1079267 RepID=A0A9P9ICY7_9HYPO|nr:hypothetical protein B0J13DRAFT_533409 [Dactylonectria estremocensis]
MRLCGMTMFLGRVFEAGRLLSQRQPGSRRGGPVAGQRQRIPGEIEAIELLSQRWAQVDDQERHFLLATHPLTDLEAIPEVNAWKAAQQLKSGDEADESDEDIVMDFISVASSYSSPLLPPLAYTNDSDSDAVEIVTTTRIE